MKATTSASLFVIVAALALAACGPATIVSNPAPAEHTLSVTGNGTVTLTPDIAYINVGVHSDMPTASEAVSANNTQTQQAL